MFYQTYLTFKEVKAKYHVSASRIYEWLSLGAPCLQLGGRGTKRLFPEAELDAWLREPFGINLPDNNEEKGGES